MYTLYFTRGSASMAPHALLEEIGAAYVLKHIDAGANQQNDPAYLRLNPHGRVPTLVIDGSQVIYESAAICLTLADRHAQAGLAPATDDPLRGAYYQWLAYLTNTIQERYLLFFYPERNISNPAHALEVKASATQQLIAHWQRVDQALAKGPYLLGDRFSVCDLYLHMLYSWRDPVLQLEANCRNLHRTAELVAARPAVQRMLAQNDMAA
jgi:glutathione S-transferase